MTPQRKFQFDGFLSYASDDEERVLVVNKALEGLGLHVWRDKEQIPLGDSFIEKIEAGLSQSGCVVLFVSQKALGSKWVQREWNIALTLNMRIIPVRLDDSELPLMLRPLEYIDFPDSSQLEVAAQKIADGIRGLAVAPAVPKNSSNPSVLGKDVIVISRMIANEQRAIRNLDVARWAAAVMGLAVAASVIILGRCARTPWIAIVAAGSLILSGVIVWAITAQSNLNRSEIRRLNGIKDGIELYCPNQPACTDFRIQLETILKKLAGIWEAV
jgi:hypothetical protein